MNTKCALKIVCTLLLILAFSMAVNGGLFALVNAQPTTASAKIWTDKADYHPGTLVTIYGTGFNPHSAIALNVTKMKDGSVTSGHILSDSKGNFAATYQIDKVGAPLYDVSATDGVNTAKTTFTDSGSISLSEQSGVVGDTVTITGNGFTPSTDYTATFDSALLPLNGPTTTDSSGNIPQGVKFTVPSCPCGIYTIQLTIGSDTPFALFSIMIFSALDNGASQGYVDDTLILNGAGFYPGETVDINDAGSGNTLTKLSANSAGNIVASSFTIPDFIGGQYTLQAYGETSQLTADAAPFSVLSSISVSPSPVTVGSPVTVSGTGFAANPSSHIISVTLDDNPVNFDTNSLQSVLFYPGGSDGSFTATYTIPTLTSIGQHTLEVQDDAGHQVSVNFLVGTPDHIIVSSTSVIAGQPETFTVNAYDASGNLIGDVTNQCTFTISGQPVGSSVTKNTAADYSVDVSYPGVPYVTADWTVSPAGASYFVVSAPSSADAGTAFTVMVTSKDLYGNVATGYSGTFSFGSSDPNLSGLVVLPAAQSLIDGTGTFGVTLVTAGSQTITATDNTYYTMTGTSAPIQVNPSTAVNVAISGGSSVTAGSPVVFTATATDIYGNQWDATSQATWNVNSGAGTYLWTTNSVQDTKAGSWTVKATLGALTATAGLTVNPNLATQLVVSGFPNPTAATFAHIVTVTAKDQYGNIATTYSGTIGITSSDSAAGLPSSSTLTSGVGTFSVTLNTAGTQSITASGGSITGSQSGITVNAVATLTVSFSVVGGGSGSSTPTITYVLAGQTETYPLAGTPTAITVDAGSSWSVSPNLLTGSTTTERWISNNTLAGTAPLAGDSETQEFTYYQQYKVSFGYTTNDGTSINSKIRLVTYTQSGVTMYLDTTSSGTLVAAGTTTAVSHDWADANSQVTFTSPISMSSNEQYKILYSDYGSDQVISSVSVTANSATPMYFDQVKVNYATSVNDGSTPLANFHDGNGAVAFFPYLNWAECQYNTMVEQASGAGYVWCNVGSHVYFDASIPEGTQASPTERWVANNPIYDLVSVSLAGTTLNQMYYHQFTFTLSYFVSGGDSQSAAPTLTSTQFGNAYTPSLTGSVTAYWLDTGASWGVTNPLGGSSSTERWQTSQAASGMVSATQTTAYIYYHQYLVTFKSATNDGGSILPNTYYQQFNTPQSVQAIVYGTGSSEWVDAGSAITYDNPTTISTSSQRWIINGAATPLATISPSVGESETADPTYYHQYEVQASYTTNDGSTTSSSITLSGVQFGNSAFAATLTKTSQNVWLDSTGTWSETNQITGLSGDQWITTAATTGTISSSIAISPLYYHQFYITVNNGGYGTPSQLSQWVNASSSFSTLVTTPADVTSGVSQWITSQPILNIANVAAAQTLVFSWTEQFYLTVVSAYGSPSGQGWVNSGATANFSVTSPDGTSGTRYVFNAWSGDSASNDVTSSIVMTGANTVSANWKTQYQATFIQSGLDSSANSNTALTVGSTAYAYSNLPSGLWINSGTTFSWSTSVSGDSGKQFVYIADSGFSSPITASGTDTANYTTQFQVNFVVTPVGTGSTTPSGASIWVNVGPLAISASANSGYKFSSWISNTSSTTLIDANSASTTANIGAPTILTATIILNALLITPAISVSTSALDQGLNSTLTASGISGGVGPYSYQWLSEAPSASSYYAVSGATTTTYNFSTDITTVTGTWTFELKIIDTLGATVTSTSATVTVNYDPYISIGPTSWTSSTDQSSNVLLKSASSGGTGTLSYEWYVNGTKTGTGDPTYVYNAQNAGLVKIYVTVTDSLGITAQSNSATITVTAPESTPTPTLTPTPTPKPTPTPNQNQNATTIPATTDTGATVDLAITGSIAITQMSAVTIASNQTSSTTTISFNVTGPTGTTGYSNITIPKTEVPYGTTPTVYIDGEQTQNQSCTQDANNYYVWYTTHFSIHQVRIEFTGKAEQTTYNSLELIVFVIIIIAVVLMTILVALKHRKPAIIVVN